MLARAHREVASLQCLQVIDMHERMRIYIEDEREKAVQTAREEATEEAITRIKQKMREEIEAERDQLRREAGACVLQLNA